jgi:hypothetical protein
VKKITLYLSDEVYRRVQAKAAERDASVNALVGECLMSLVDEETDFERRRRLQDEVLKTVRWFRGAARVKRDRSHDRALR